jgi:Protein of unknown function (DUF2971)
VKSSEKLTAPANGNLDLKSIRRILMADNESLMQAAEKLVLQLRGAIVSKRVLRMKQGLNPDKSPAGEPEHLAHYTTADGLRGIIQNGCLWASGAYYLNDSSEIDYGCRLFIDLLTKAIGEEGRDPVSKKIFEDAKKAFEPGGSMQSLITRTYVACFCENANLLSQWRTYGQSGGYSIYFPLMELRNSLTANDEYYQVELQRVVYDGPTQIQLLQLAVSDVLLTMAEKNIVELWKSFDVAQKKVFIISLNMFLQTMAATEIIRFKHPSFAEEREWRLAVRPASPHFALQEIQQLQFRTARGMLIPYVELRPKEGALLPIKRVRYGPTLEKKRVLNSLELLFKQKKYADVQFEGSEIPVILP